ncbi:hypothetical protein NAPIS_ORF01948, partial [Vairimorpha apis BRL 01]
MNTIIDTITHKLHTLHSILSSILPIEFITQCPFEHYSEKINRIYNFIDLIIKESQEEQKKFRDNLKKHQEYEINLYKDLIFDLQHDLSFNNDSLINKIYNSMPLLNKIDINSNINECSDDLNFIYNRKDLILDDYKNFYDMILSNYNLQEKNRLKYYKKIKIFKDKLNLIMDLDINDKLNNINKQYKELKKFAFYIDDLNNQNINFLSLDYKNSITNSKVHITNADKSQTFIVKDLLDYNNLSDEHFDKLYMYRAYLDEQYNLKLEEIYTYNVKILNNLLLLFNLPAEKYDMTDEGIKNLKKRINSLKMKESFYVKITDLINKRSNLIQMMNEFEIIASDPKRLFKSSFQLNKEEKFRKNAVPNLIRIENEIISKINEYKLQFGDFIYKGEKYEDILKKENSNRIMNKT